MLRWNINKSIYYLTNKGTRIALRSRVNDFTESFIDSYISIGKKQLILGDRLTGKSSIFLNISLIIIPLFSFKRL